eukprot:188081-Prymnesium_polylepis.1
MAYAQIHGSALCCWRHPHQRYYDASSAHGAMVGAWYAPGPNGAVAAGNGSVEDDIAQASGCERRCDRLPRCAFISHSMAARRCVYCAACALRALNSVQQSYTSWARPSVGAVGGAPSFAGRSLPQRALLGPMLLRGEYSTSVYGAEGLGPPIDTLRLVWLALLPPQALKALAAVGACRYEPRPPLQPFFTNIDRDRANPVDALW